MSKKKIIPGEETGANSSFSTMPLADEERELIRFINSVEMTYSGVELLNMKPRLVAYLRRLQEKGL